MQSWALSIMIEIRHVGRRLISYQRLEWATSCPEIRVSSLSYIGMLSLQPLILEDLNKGSERIYIFCF